MPDGHGGHVCQSVGNLLANSLGNFLASLVFFLLTIFSVLFTFSIEPRSLLKLFEVFKREPREEGAEEDLGALKRRMAPTPEFQLREGVPVEHSPIAARMPGARASAEKVAPTSQAALTTVWKRRFPASGRWASRCLTSSLPPSHCAVY
jgi:hypothetical protein